MTQKPQYPAIQVYKVHDAVHKDTQKTVRLFKKYHLTTTAPDLDAAVEEAQLLHSSKHVPPKHMFRAALVKVND